MPTYTLTDLQRATRSKDNFPMHVSDDKADAIVTLAVRNTLGFICLSGPVKLDLLNGYTLHVMLRKQQPWGAGQPPKRGAYWTRSDPRTAKSANACWRYWDGERWGMATRSREGALQTGKPSARFRRCTLLHAVLWRTKKEA